MVIAVDACIITKIYLEEEGSEEASRLLEEYGEAVAPVLIRVEVASSFSRKYRMGEISEGEASLVYARWKKQSLERWINLIPNEELLDSAMALSIKLKHGLADCLYLAAAKKLRIPLLTADRPFYRRCHSHHAMRLLGK